MVEKQSPALSVGLSPLPEHFVMMASDILGILKQSIFKEDISVLSGQ